MVGSYITKSDFLDFCHCSSHFWMTRHQPDQVHVPLTPEDQRLLFFGNQIDQLARTLYPEGVAIDGRSNAEALEQTQLVLDDPAVSVVFQAAVYAEPGYFARADILIREGHQWRLIEAKGSNNVDSDHIIDASFQVLALEAAGYDIASVSILHLNKAYRRNGAIDPLRLLVEEDVTEKVMNKLVEVAETMVAARDRVADLTPPETCECNRKTRSNHCPGFARFHPNVPAEGSIYELNGLRESKLAEVLERGIISLKDWPADVALTSGQELQIQVLRSGEPSIDHDVLSSVLNQVAFPIYFLDYETSSVPIPMFEGAGPFQQVPFQYSLHVINEDGNQRHHAYLATDTTQHPVRDLVAQLRQDVGDVGSVVVWNKSFEISINKDMAELAPEHAELLLGLNARTVDLMEAVSKGGYVHPDFRGSSSIKKVLPVLAPDLSYSTLAIQDGGAASEQWLTCALGEVSADEQAVIFKNLLEYCQLDTLAMVRIWDALRAINDSSEPTIQ